MLVDTHCHLNFDRFDQDRDAVLERARAGGVVRILNPAIDLATSRAVIELAEGSPEVWAAVGVHPNDALTWDESTLPALRALAVHPKVAAIGEIGLDYYWERTPVDLQKRVLRQQLDLAAEMGLPVVIHTRNAGTGEGRAVADTLEILEDWVSRLASVVAPLTRRPGVLHSFSGELEEAGRAWASGFLIGITGPVTFRKADLLRQVAAALPLQAVLPETDAPFLTPHPHRGERNEPAYVRYVVEKLAQVRNLEYEVMAQVTFDNAKRLFHW